MAVPKKKTSKARRDKRKSQTLTYDPAQLATCSACRSPKLPHRACPTCGTYRGRQYVAPQGS